MKIPIILTAALILAALSAPLQAQSPMTDEENRLLALALEKNFAGDGHTVVAPDLSPMKFMREGEGRDRIKQALRKVPALNGCDCDALVERFFARNKEPLRLTLESNASNGYVVDYDGRFDAYFGEGRGGWEQWRKENRQARGWTTVSVPAFDQASGVILLYLGTQFDWTAGGGYLVVYKLEKGQLAELGRIMLWIS